MSFDEPHPEYRGPATWPMWAALPVGLASSWLVLFLTNTCWGLLGYLPFTAAVARIIVLCIVRSRRFNRESDAWRKRMHAYYDRRINRVWN